MIIDLRLFPIFHVAGSLVQGASPRLSAGGTADESVCCALCSLSQSLVAEAFASLRCHFEASIRRYWCVEALAARHN